MQIIPTTLDANIASVDVAMRFRQKGVRACAAMLQQQKGIESISFISNGISEQAAAAILELLAAQSEEIPPRQEHDWRRRCRAVAALLLRRNMEDFKMAGSDTLQWLMLAVWP